MAKRVDVLQYESVPVWIASALLLELGACLLFGTRPSAHWEALWILVGAVVGYAASGYKGALTARCIAKRCGAESGDVTWIVRDDFKEGLFLSVTSILIGCYVVAYQCAAYHFAGTTAEWPIPWPVAAVTAVTIGALGYFSARYAIYNRIGGLLDSALGQERRPVTVRFLRDAIFRESHLFEPPGSVFVTVGITATFLGLAFGLVTLDLPSLFATPDAGASDEAARGARVLRALTAFTGCMGLALGVSMLGVLTSIAAQWLRGYGPMQDVDDLIARADGVIAWRGTGDTQIPNADAVPEAEG